MSSSKRQELIGLRPDFFFHLGNIHHDDGIPRAAIEEAAVGTLAQALLAADAKEWVDLNAAKRWVVLIVHPEHAILDGTVFHASGRPGATCTAFGDDRQFFGFLLPRGGNSLGTRLVLLFIGDHPRGFSSCRFRGHGVGL
jgi:hypothetical protein